MSGRHKRQTREWYEIYYPYLYGPRRAELLAKGEIGQWLGIRWVRRRL